MIKTFDEYNKSKDDVKNFEQKMFKLIDEWVKISGYHKDILDNYKDCFNFTKVNFNEYPWAKKVNSYFHINYNGFNSGSYITLPKNEYEDLLKFIENPEIYRASKKYNL